MVTCRDDPCGFVCIIITYCAVLYADYVVVNWLIIPSSMSSSLWGAFHALIFNTIVLCLTVAHFRAVLSDPGIVPLPTAAIDFSDVRTGQPMKSRIDRVSGQSWTVCQKCEAYRPPRAHHCRICRRCVRKMDHHCPWINNCVGEFNQKYFIQFLFYVGMASLYSIIVLIIAWSGECPSCKDMDEKNARIAHSIVLVVISLLFGLFVAAIGCDQISAIFEDETLVEQVKNRGHQRTATQRTKMDLLREVFGNGPMWYWMIPCRSTQYRRFIPPSFNV
ncbi:palmitoyltransferase ZDHHC7 [Strongylocentrotus purpuratus]|uniref:Palmitoyltransferase n=1 Tax=Strongylocentrotus purpuratus TaxID=7668 RepID=A0A7M7LPF0_STRPU|nr:palmitoyltransferase ZDHHC7 [Strongylocentrotus purpuratus]